MTDERSRTDLSRAKNLSGNLTHVDLGDDLLVTALVETPPPAAVNPSPSPAYGQVTAVGTGPSNQVGEGGLPVSVQDQLESARILQGEGLGEEAKKILRRLLIADPRNAVVQQALKAIQENELRGLLDGSNRFDPGSNPMGESERLKNQLTGEEILASLDRDLGLGLLIDSPQPDPTTLEEFLSDLESVLAQSTQRDRIDLGIAYLEMGSPAVAEHCFRMARLGTDRNGEQGQIIAASALLAQAQLSSGRALDALHTLQAALKGADPGVDAQAERVELLYLAAEASALLDRAADAIVFYTKVREIEPGYRDVEERLLGLRAAAGSSQT